MPKQNTTLAACCASHTLHDGFSDVTYVLLPLLAQTFGLSLSQVGMIRSAHRAAMAAFQIPAGLVAERFGERNLLAIGTVIAGSAFVLLGFATGYWMILAALFFAGIGSAVQHPLSSTIISRTYPAAGRRTALGMYNFAGDVGKFTFGGIVSLLMVAGITWQSPVVAFGLLGIATALAMLWLLPATASRHRQARASGEKSVGWGIKHPKGFIALCLIEIVDASARTGFLTFIAFLLVARGIPEGWAALSVPLILVGGMAGKLACGMLADRFGVVRMIVITEIATGCGVLAALALPAMGTFFLLPIVGVMLNGTSSVLYATIADYVDEKRLSRSFGLFYTLGSICGIAAPLGYGFIGDLYGVETSIAIIGVTVFLTIPLTALLTTPSEARLNNA